MRVLASADVHGRLAVYEWLLTTAREHDVDAILLAGDLLACPDGFDTPEQAQRHEAQTLTDLLEAACVPVLYIMGNDDLVELDSRSPRIQSIHERRVTIGAFSFLGYQYSLPFMGGVFEKSEDGIDADLAALTRLVDTHTVFVSHSPALGILDPGFDERRIGSSSLRRYLERTPFLVHIHGHSHAGFGRLERHFNVASAGRTRAMIVNLETMEHEVLGVQKPDFSGEWTLNVGASALSPIVAPVVENGFVHIEHREPTIAVHLSITMDGKPFDVRFERPSNWDGEALVFTDTTDTPHGELTISFRYQLEDSGRRLRATEWLRGGGREQDNVWVFDRAISH